MPGLSVAEPVSDFTQVGADVERDDDYRVRAMAKWASLGAGANDAA